MNRRIPFLALLVLGLSSLTACPGEDDVTGDAGSGGGLGGAGGDGGAGGEGGDAGGAGGDVGGSGGGGDGLSCEEIRACSAACQDPSCVDGCVAQGSAEGAADLGDLDGCLVENACVDAEGPSCGRVHCAAELGACGVRVGRLVCVDMFWCIENCDGEACLFACLGRGAQASGQLAFALDACAIEQGCYDAEDFVTCLETSCAAEGDACLQDGA